MTGCTHCGMAVGADPVTAAEIEGAFCCRGCLETYRLLQDDG